jgi:hypothetical protein
MQAAPQPPVLQTPAPPVRDNDLLERVEAEYLLLSTKLIYDLFAGKASAQEERRVDELSRERVRLTAPDFSAAA